MFMCRFSNRITFLSLFCTIEITSNSDLFIINVFRIDSIGLELVLSRRGRIGEKSLVYVVYVEIEQIFTIEKFIKS